MRLGNALRDVEAQSEAAAISTPRLPEAIEQSFTLFLRNAWSRIGHGHADFVGLDTTYFIAEIMFNEYREKRFAPPPLLKRMVVAGRLGKKSGRGFYEYGAAK